MFKLSIIKARSYYDSVTLMAISQEVTGRDGVIQAMAAMATDHNKELLEGVGLLTDDARGANPDDLVIAIAAESEQAARAGAEAAEQLLQRKGGGAAAAGGGVPAPRSLAGAVKQMPDANLAVVSVPGAFAKREAKQALEAGLHVMVFSDNMSLADEVELKQLARAKGLLCMGPDCGTAIIGGVALCFANVVRRGRVGIVAASGTGSQEVSVLIDRMGGGISQLIGTGGRDLKPEVGGLMMLSGIEMLAQDPETETILLISKPPHPEVAAKVLDALRASGKRGIACFLGYTGAAPDGVQLATTLQEAAELATGADWPASTLDADAAALARRVPVGATRLCGLFSGGTLCDEAKLELGRMGLSAQAELVDYGDDEYTVGRPHPMIDFSLRLEKLTSAAADPTTAVILLDVVLGYGAHGDPASALAPVLREIRQPVVAYVCGTEADPQSRSRQVQALAEAGARVAASNLEAARLAGLTLQHREGAR